MTGLHVLKPKFVLERGSGMQHAMNFIIQGGFIVGLWTSAEESEAIS